MPPNKRMQPTAQSVRPLGLIQQGGIQLSFVRRGLGWLLQPLHRFMVVHMKVADPWEPASTFLINPHRFGPGSRKPFSWYFEGESAVVVGDIAAICEWLAGCQYTRDADLFRDPDYWQHPLTFEQLRKGDCEDHALWAWRKMVELGAKAHFYVGQWRQDPEHTGFHAWVVFEKDGRPFLLDPVFKDVAKIVRPLDEARVEYVPHFSVDASFKMCARAGLLVYWREEELARRARKRAKAA
jgi:hypothetical protein